MNSCWSEQKKNCLFGLFFLEDALESCLPFGFDWHHIQLVPVAHFIANHYKRHICVRFVSMCTNNDDDDDDDHDDYGDD